MNKSGIYLIKNLTNGKVYIGSSVDILKRWKTHKSLLKSLNHHSRKLQNSWNKHGADKFLFEVIELCDKEFLIEKEQFWINYFDSYNKGYNCTELAQYINFRKGFKHTDESKLKIGQAAKKMWTDDYKKEFSFKKTGKNGKKHSEVTKQKLREINLGKKHTDETKNKISVYSKLKKLSEHHKEALRKSNIGKIVSEETKNKIRQTLKKTRNNTPFNGF